MLLFIFLCKLYDSLTTSSWSWPLKYSLLIQMDLSSSICEKNGKTLLHFQSVTMCGRATNVSGMTAHSLFFFHCFPLICSPSVELSSVSFCKVSAWERFHVEAKKLSSVRTRFLDGRDIFWKISPLRDSRRHARVSMSHVHQSVARAWNALGTISGGGGGGGSRNFEPFVKVSRLDETLLKWFWETKSHDKSFILNQNFVV